MTRPTSRRKGPEPGEKVVEVTLRLSASFVRLLNASASLGGVVMTQLRGDEPRRQLSAAEALHLVVLSEARGNHAEATYARTPHEWRGEIEAVPEARAVYMVGENGTTMERLAGGDQ